MDISNTIKEEKEGNNLRDNFSNLESILDEYKSLKIQDKFIKSKIEENDKKISGFVKSMFYYSLGMLSLKTFEFISKYIFKEPKSERIMVRYAEHGFTHMEERGLEESNKAYPQNLGYSERLRINHKNHKKLEDQFLRNFIVYEGSEKDLSKKYKVELERVEDDKFGSLSVLKKKDRVVIVSDVNPNELMNQEIIGIVDYKKISYGQLLSEMYDINDSVFPNSNSSFGFNVTVDVYNGKAIRFKVNSINSDSKSNES